MNLISDHKMRERVHKGAKEKEAEEEIFSHEKINDVLYNKTLVNQMIVQLISTIHLGGD